MPTERELKWAVQEDLECELRDGDPCNTCLHDAVRALTDLVALREAKMNKGEEVTKV